MKRIAFAFAVLAAAMALSCASKNPVPVPERDLNVPYTASYVTQDTPFNGKLQIIAFNIERGFFWQDVAKYAEKEREQVPATVLLLSELDRNHSRTGDIFVADELARALKMNVVFVTEFVEYNDETPDPQGDHGNAILSPFPVTEVTAIRHRTIFDWSKYGKLQGEPRYGDRVTIGATIELPGGKKVRVYAAHLESNADTVGKWLQMKQVLADADNYDLPTAIGGDFNELPYMLMFDLFPFHHIKNSFWDKLSPTGDCKPGDGRARCLIKIDWIVHKNMTPVESSVDYPLNSKGGVISDHVPVRVVFELD